MQDNSAEILPLVDDEGNVLWAVLRVVNATTAKACCYTP